MQETSTDRGRAFRSDAAEDLADAFRRGDVAVATRCGRGGHGMMIQEVNIDPVRVVFGANRSDSRDGFLGFGPAAPAHAGTIIDEEDGVEVFEKCESIILVNLRGILGDCWEGFRPVVLLGTLGSFVGGRIPRRWFRLESRGAWLYPVAVENGGSWDIVLT